MDETTQLDEIRARSGELITAAARRISAAEYKLGAARELALSWQRADDDVYGTAARELLAVLDDDDGDEPCSFHA